MAVKLQGGLGNQMLIAAYGLSKGCRTFDISSFDKDDLRHYELDQYDLDIELVRDPDAEAGYFQDEKFFDAELVRKLFGVPKGTPNSACMDMADRIIGNDCTFLGIRRADYLWPERVNYHGVLDFEDYYCKALCEVPEPVFVFTDDLPWAYEHFGNHTVVDVNGPNEKAWDIWLMSLCKHAIIANSTFQWLGAWLGADKTGGTVIAPKKWFSDERVNAECTLVPERWVRV